jgi:hypothetical protein
VKRFLSVVITVFVFVVLAYLPVVPISVGPVVLNATYSLRTVSLFEILWFPLAGPEGVSCQYHWYTYAVILVLLAIGCLVSVLVFRKIGGSSK